MKKAGQQPTLDRPVTYQIKVPGHIDMSWTDWDGRMIVEIGNEDDGTPVTTLTGKLDQSALHGLLRRLYALGIPLISVICVDCGSEYVDLSQDNF